MKNIKKILLFLFVSLDCFSGFTQCDTVPLPLDTRPRIRRQIDSVGAINVYPNPVKSSFNVYMPQPSKVQITNESGQLMHTGYYRNRKETIYVNYPNGIYFVKVTCEKESAVYKIVVIK